MNVVPLLAIAMLTLVKHHRFDVCACNPLYYRFAPMGDLHTLLATIEDTITEAHQLTMAQQVCSGMEALSAKGLVHRDLASRNVLVFAYDEADPTITSVKVSHGESWQLTATF